MEIKQGDKVRVRKDAPRVYQKSSVFDYTEHQSTVHEVDGDAAIIGLDMEDSPIYSAPIAIPTKYLIKDDTEAKEAKFKKGDKVRFKEVYTVQSVDDGQVFIDSAGNFVDEDCLELYTEPKEQTEAETDSNNFKKEAEEWANTVSNAIKEYGDVMCQTYIDAHTEAYWDAYTADLAKEIALKLANKYNDPEQAAEYAVSVAKAVVGNLRNK